MRQKGYTLAEVIMAMALLLVILTFIAGLFLNLFVASTKNLDSTVALEMADALLTKISDSDPASWKDIKGPLNVALHDPRTTTEFKVDLQGTDTPIPDPSPGDMGNIYKVDIIVSWMDKDNNPKRRQYGQTAVKLSKMVYVSNMKI